MTSTPADIINRALQLLGTRTTVSAAELAAQSSNEAIQAMILYDDMRDNLSRMAPWDFCSGVQNLIYLTSLPGTPENQSPMPPQWQHGLPLPPWAYEYAYPSDCLRALRILPAVTTQFAGTPIYPINNGYIAPADGPEVRFKIGTDKLYPVTAVQILGGGTQHYPGDVLTTTNQFTPDFDPASMADDFVTSPIPLGCSPLIQVLSTEPNAGAILTAAIVQGPGPTDYNGYLSGGYFRPPISPQVQATTTGDGAGAVFQYTPGTRTDMRVILTNQTTAFLAYVKRVTDITAMDPLFITAWCEVLAAGLAMALTGDKNLANLRIQSANRAIMEARSIDGNEGFDVYDVSPDWINIRGDYGCRQFYSGINWGPLWPSV